MGLIQFKWYMHGCGKNASIKCIFSLKMVVTVYVMVVTVYVILSKSKVVSLLARCKIEAKPTKLVIVKNVNKEIVYC